MEEHILPIYFRHTKFESFVRQLNIYGFKKIKSTDRHRFTHPLLHLGCGYSCFNIRLSSITSAKNSKQKEGLKNHSN